MTIKDIAQKCGVSVSTVSRVINNHEYVNEEVRKRVLEVIEEEHFVPHSGAVGLVRPQQDTIGIVVRGVANLFFSSMLPIFDEAATAAGYTVITQQIKTTDDELFTAASLAKEKNLKGVVLLGGRYDWTEKETAVLNIPFVCCTFKNLLRGGEKLPYVGIDDEREAYRAVEELIDHGHRRIAILLPKMNDKSVSGLRFSGYQRALQDHGIELDPALIIEANSFTAQGAYDGMKRLIQSDVAFTGVFVISDYMAIAAMKATVDAGLRIPQDCSFIAIDGIEISNYTVPTLSTMVQPRREIAEKAIQILCRQISGDTSNLRCPLQATLREGGSLRYFNN